MRNRLDGDAAIYKSLLDRDLLRDGDQGVNYFKRTLRQHFVKGNQSIFLWRFFQLFRATRGQYDILRWIGRFQVVVKRVLDAWMDLHEPPDDAQIAVNQEYQEALQNAAAAQGANLTAQQVMEVAEQYRGVLRRRHQNAFPLNEHMLALIMVAQADLTEVQRERFASSMSLRGLNVQQYTVQAVRDMFIELFCAPRSSLENPLLGSGPTQGTRSFCIIDEGEMDGVTGYWVEDDESGDVGFLPEFEDMFWRFDEPSEAWVSRYFKGRRMRIGLPKRKGKGHGKGGKRRFKPRGKGKRRKGSYSHWGEGEDDEEEMPDEYADWNSGGKRKGKGKKGKKAKRPEEGQEPQGPTSGGKSKGKGKHAHLSSLNEWAPPGSSTALTPVPENTYSPSETEAAWTDQPWSDSGWNRAYLAEEVLMQRCKATLTAVNQTPVPRRRSQSKVPSSLLKKLHLQTPLTGASVDPALCERNRSDSL